MWMGPHLPNNLYISASMYVKLLALSTLAIQLKMQAGIINNKLTLQEKHSTLL